MQMQECFEEAQRHYQEGICHIEIIGDPYRSAWFRFNAAINLANFGRLYDALDYARYAFEKFEAFGPAGIKEVHETQKLIAQLEEALRSK